MVLSSQECNHLSCSNAFKNFNNGRSKLELIDDDGETVNDEIMLKAMIEKFWGDLFSMNVDATLGSKNCRWWYEE